MRRYVADIEDELQAPSQLCASGPLPKRRGRLLQPIQELPYRELWGVVPFLNDDSSKEQFRGFSEVKGRAGIRGVSGIGIGLQKPKHVQVAC